MHGRALRVFGSFTSEAPHRWDCTERGWYFGWVQIEAKYSECQSVAATLSLRMKAHVGEVMPHFKTTMY